MSAFDVMPDIPLYQPTGLEEALELVERLGKHAWLLAGGQDTFGWLKDRAKTATALIDLNGVAALRGINRSDSDLSIGAMATLSEIQQHPQIQQHYPLLVDAAARVASPQIRNVGTLGGNLCQDARCWYYRRGVDCYRAGGNICYADSPQGMNREHSLFDASRCVAVTPSDTAIALVALDATFIIASRKGSNRVAAKDFFLGPEIDIARMTRLKPGEILVRIELPQAWEGARVTFEKVADRNVWDFALVSLATAFQMEGNKISKARLVCGGVACTPYRLRALEQALTGNTLSENTRQMVRGLATRGAQPLRHNSFKIPLLENLVQRALRD